MLLTVRGRSSVAIWSSHCFPWLNLLTLNHLRQPGLLMSLSRWGGSSFQVLFSTACDCVASLVLLFVRWCRKTEISQPSLVSLKPVCMTVKKSGDKHLDAYHLRHLQAKPAPQSLRFQRIMGLYRKGRSESDVKSGRATAGHVLSSGCHRSAAAGQLEQHPQAPDQRCRLSTVLTTFASRFYLYSLSVLLPARPFELQFDCLCARCYAPASGISDQNNHSRTFRTHILHQRAFTNSAQR
jgi:hypothetical protein